MLDPSIISDTFFKNVDFRNSSTVDRFIANTLQLNEANRKAVSEAVDLLYNHIQHKLPSVSRNEPHCTVNKLVKVRVTALCIEC